MTKLKYISFIICAALLFSSCEKDEEIDTQKPTINIDFANAFPKNCEVIYFDEPFSIRAVLSDNVQLGSFSIDIHNNFDHHTHSTEFESCPLDDIKDPVNPYLIIEDFSIPEGLSEYETEVMLTIPSTDGTNLYDEGDYHFHLGVTDQEGWASQIGLHIKILHQ
ncbi:MAG: DUF4625 domain-containing protein [Bacteroidota bacterium]